MSENQAIGMAALGAAVLGFFFGALSHRAYVRFVIRTIMKDFPDFTATVRTDNDPVGIQIDRRALLLRMLNGGPIR